MENILETMILRRNRAVLRAFLLWIGCAFLSQGAWAAFSGSSSGLGSLTEDSLRNQDGAYFIDSEGNEERDILDIEPERISAGEWYDSNDDWTGYYSSIVGNNERTIIFADDAFGRHNRLNELGVVSVHVTFHLEFVKVESMDETSGGEVLNSFFWGCSYREKPRGKLGEYETMLLWDML